MTQKTVVSPQDSQQLGHFKVLGVREGQEQEISRLLEDLELLQALEPSLAARQRSSRPKRPNRCVRVCVCAVYLGGPARSAPARRWCFACSCGGTSSGGHVSARPGRPGPPGGQNWSLVANTQDVSVERFFFFTFLTETKYKQNSNFQDHMKK